MGLEMVAPEAPALERIPRTVRAANTESMVEDALSFLADDEPSAPAPKKTSKDAENTGRGPREVPLPESEEEGEDYTVEDPDDDADGSTDDEPAEGKSHAEEITIGTKEAPYPGDSLPKDRFVKLKSDGEEVVVDFQELARGYIGNHTTQKRLQIAADALKHAEARVAESNEVPKQVRKQLDDLLSNDEDLFEFLLHRDENIVLKLAQRMAQRIRHFKENPQALYEERLARERAKLNAEREAIKAENDRVKAEAEQRAQQEARQRMFLPGWNDGLKRAGFPELTEAKKRELYEEVNIRCQHRAASGKVVTTADVSEFVVRACKALDIGPKGKKPAPAGRPAAPTRRPETRRSEADKKWEGVPVSRRIRNDPDFLLQGISLKEFTR